MPSGHVVVLVIDRLGAGWIGPYGNTWLETPEFNRLAAQSELFETAIAESADLNHFCRSVWTGEHAVRQEQGASETGRPLSRGDWRLLTDEAEVLKHPLAEAFGQRRLVEFPADSQSAETVEDTSLYGFFSAARDAVSQQRGPGLLWLHSRGLCAAWDAPLALRYQFADEDDPTPPDLTGPPEKVLGENFDPDELLGYVQAYAGQVALADMCLGMLLDALEEPGLAGQTTLVVTSPRGYPLGEHRRVGPCDEALYGELLHVPLLVRWPGKEQALARRQQIVQPRDIYPLIAALCGDAAGRPGRLGETASHEGFELRRAAHARGPGQRAIRTPAWFLRESLAAGETRRELFAKPDDRWEANEVSSRCGEAVELLAAELDRFDAAAGAEEAAESPPLAELLCDVWR